MASRTLPGTDLRVRRSGRRDAPQVRALLGPGALPERECRRLLASLATDVYVAEDAAGRLVGLVSLAYARSLVRGGWAAVLDGVRTAGHAAGVVDGLVAFAEERARRRGCRRLTAWVDPADRALRAALLARGYRPGEALARELGETT
jgi:GNAT superfamily N-acetyltransferase